MPAIVITYCAHKGGVGKTSLAVNFAGYLAKTFKAKILMIDADPQSNLSKMFIPPDKLASLRPAETLAAAFDERLDMDPAAMIHETPVPGLSIVPATKHLKRFNLPCPAEQPEAMQRGIRELIQLVRDDYLFVCCDTNPTLDLLPTWSAILSAHFVLSPTQPEIYSAQAVAELDEVLAAAQERNPKLQFLGYVINGFKKRVAIHESNVKRLRAIHGDRVLKTMMLDRIAVTEAQSKRVPITEYDGAGDAKEIAEDLAKEICLRIQSYIRPGVQTNTETGKEAA